MMDPEGRPDAEAATLSDHDDDATVLHEAIARLRRHRRALAIALVAATVIGAVAGAAVERRTRGEDVQVAATPLEDDATDGQGDVGRDDIDDSDGELATPTTISQGFGSSETAVDSLGSSDGYGYGYGYGYGEPLTWLGSAPVADVEVRLLGADYPTPDDDNPFWEAPAGCYATGHVRLEVSSARFALPIQMERYDVPGRPDGTVQLLGIEEGDPRWIVIASVPAAGATVRFPDGQTGTAVDIAGYAVAAAPAPGWEQVPQDETGHTASVESGGTSVEVHTWHHPTEEFYMEQCEPPPPSLPEPGEQPDDPAAANEAVRAALTAVFGPSERDAKAANVVDPDIVLPALEQLVENYPDLATTAAMGDIVFTAPDTAWFLYDLDADIVRFTDQIGEATLLDGRWLITTETVCAQLRKGGATCEAPA